MQGSQKVYSTLCGHVKCVCKDLLMPSTLLANCFNKFIRQEVAGWFYRVERTELLTRVKHNRLVVGQPEQDTSANRPAQSLRQFFYTFPQTHSIGPLVRAYVISAHQNERV